MTLSVGALIVGLIVVALLYWVVKKIPHPAPQWLVDVLFALAAVYVILNAFGLAGGLGIHW